MVAEWKVKLTGERFDLEDLSNQLCSPNLSVVAPPSRLGSRLLPSRIFARSFTISLLEDEPE